MKKKSGKQRRVGLPKFGVIENSGMVLVLRLSHNKKKRVIIIII